MKNRIIAILLVIAFALLFWSSSELQQQFGVVTEKLDVYVEANPIQGIVFFISLAALSALLSPFSSLPTLPFAIQIWGTLFTFLFLIIGWTIGSLLSYGVGRYGLLVLFRRLINFQKIEKYRRDLSGNSEFALVVLFRLALPSELTGLVLGILRYDIGKYILATLISEIPFALVSVFVCDAFLMNNPWQLGLGVFIASLLTGLAIVFFAIRVKNKRSESSENS